MPVKPLFILIQVPIFILKIPIKPIHRKNCNGITNSSGVLAVHRGIAYSCINIDRNGGVVDTFKYCGSDSSTHFIKRLMSVWGSIKKYIPNYALHMTCEDIRGFSEANVCCICNIPFTKGVKKIDIMITWCVEKITREHVAHDVTFR